MDLFLIQLDGASVDARQNYARCRSGLFLAAQRLPRSLANLFSREMVSGPESGDHVLLLLGQAEELHPQPLVSFPWPLCL